MPNDLRTKAIVLRRTNYGETDRILNLLTPEGKLAVLARGVRKEKSRLAGSIELFSLADIVVHQGHASLATLTSAKMLKFYGNIVTDLSRLELAAGLLKSLERAAEQISTPEHFSLLEQSLQALDQAANLRVVATWFRLNLQRIGGEELNLLRDTAGQPLAPELHYVWDAAESALRPHPSGPIGVDQIKLARFSLAHPLSSVLKIDQIDAIIPPVYELSRLLANGA